MACREEAHLQSNYDIKEVFVPTEDWWTNFTA